MAFSFVGRMKWFAAKTHVEILHFTACENNAQVIGLMAWRKKKNGENSDIQQECS